MGIKGLSKYIEQRCIKNGKNIRYASKLSDYEGHRIAVDCMDWLYKNIYAANSKVLSTTRIEMEAPNRTEIMKLLKKAYLVFLDLCAQHTVIPIMVFDGKPPDEKEAVCDSRTKDRESRKSQIDALRSELEKLDFFDIPDQKLNELRSLTKNHTYITPTEVGEFKDFVKAIGAPWLQALGEAEPLCSMLSIEYQVAAVLSCDSDNMVYGCRTLLEKIDHYEGAEPVYQSIDNDDLLKLLDMSPEKFVDFAIMCGCDYNTNMKGIGPVNCFKLIQEHGNIDALPPKYNTTCLNHGICRTLFQYNPSRSLYEEGHLDYDKEQLGNMRAILDSCGMSEETDIISGVVRNPPTIWFEYMYNPESKDVIKIDLRKKT